MTRAPASQHPFQLFYLPSGLVVDDNGLPAAGRVVKLRLSVANRSSNTFIFSRTTHQVGCLVVEGREYVVAIFVDVNATPVGVTCPFHQAPMIEAANRHVMEWAFSFNIASDSSFFNDARHAGFAIDFLQHIINIVCVVFCLASFRKLRRYCWSREKRNCNSYRSEHRFHGGNLLQGPRKDPAKIGHRRLRRAEAQRTRAAASDGSSHQVLKRGAGEKARANRPCQYRPRERCWLCFRDCWLCTSA